VPSSNSNLRTIAIAAGLMFGAIALGAFGAHALRDTLVANGHEDVWRTATLYHAWHALGLFVLGLWRRLDAGAAENGGLRWAGRLWIAGVVAFSGSLYALSLGAPTWLGPVTPMGGACFLAGWLLVALGAIQLGRPPSGSGGAA
jgi:uncharacterized membrane protein YgdD (TMEM256/DUF423 family)